MRIKKIDVFLWLFGIVYLVATFFPTIKKIVNNTARTTQKEETWVEEPLMIEK